MKNPTTSVGMSSRWLFDLITYPRFNQAQEEGVLGSKVGIYDDE
jgi:hypothetical protein